MTLSNDFVKLHCDAWSVSKDVVATIGRIALLGDSRQRKKDRLTEKLIEQSIAQTNQDREEQRLAAERVAWSGPSSNGNPSSVSATSVNTTSTNNGQP